MSNPKIAVLDYGIGNLRSAQKGFERAGADARLTADPTEVAAADGVVLPGVGNFGRCVEAVQSHGVDAIAKDAAASGVPFLGICVGMQLMFAGSEESPDHGGLGLLPGTIRLLPGDVKRPQMQWNALHVERPSPLLDGLDGAWLYFVHSLSAELAPGSRRTSAASAWGSPGRSSRSRALPPQRASWRASASRCARSRRRGASASVQKSARASADCR